MLVALGGLKGCGQAKLSLINIGSRAALALALFGFL
jgi:hypothetical protein